ncbi:MAG: hypothetical protein AAGL89_07415 [Pseudomonadota bacterium]
MSESVYKLAAKLAEDILELQDQLDEPRLFVEMGEALGAASQTLEEAFLTEVRIRLAEREGRKFLSKRVAQIKAEKGL